MSFCIIENTVLKEGTQKEAKCSVCGKRKLCTWTHDPYMADVHGELTPLKWWCADCHEASCWEV